MFAFFLLNYDGPITKGFMIQFSLLCFHLHLISVNIMKASIYLRGKFNSQFWITNGDVYLKLLRIHLRFELLCLFAQGTHLWYYNPCICHPCFLNSVSACTGSWFLLHSNFTDTSRSQSVGCCDSCWSSYWSCHWGNCWHFNSDCRAGFNWSWNWRLGNGACNNRVGTNLSML